MTEQALDVPSASEDSHARRNAFILSAASAVNGGIPPIGITLGGLAGIYLLGPDKSLATLPVSGFNLGVARRVRKWVPTIPIVQYVSPTVWVCRSER